MSSSTTSSSSSKPTLAVQFTDDLRPCFNHFKTSNGLDVQGNPLCKFGDKCKFSHYEEVYMAFYGLKYCPNCDGKCKETSKQCGKCTEKWKLLKEEETMRRSAEATQRYEDKKAYFEELNSRPLQQCRGGRSRDQDGNVVGKGWTCENRTPMDYCSGCHNTMKEYSKRRY